jgi:hypothetical protein
VRHIEVQELWIQVAIKSHRISAEGIPGKDNPADILTKFLDKTTMNKHLERISLVFMVGRPEAVPHV